MRKLKILLWPFLGVLALGLMSHIVRSTGSPGGKSGSPGDGLKTCTDCHGGKAAAEKTGWITSDIPEAGYRPGAEYNITVKGEHPSAKLFGFELTAERAGNAKTGGFDKGGNNQIQLLSTGKAVTHTNAGTAPSGGSKSWAVKWKAPAAGTGPVTFYAAVNAANGDGGSNGDEIFTTKFSVNEQDLSSVEVADKITGIKIYPNPAREVANLEIVGMVGNGIEVSLYSINGQLVMNRKLTIENGSRTIPLPVSQFPNGTYFTVIASDNQVVKSKLMIYR